MTTILITGANGQLGQELQLALNDENRYRLINTDITTGYTTLDITNPGQVLQFCQQHQPDIIVNCAAYTAVDNAEDNPDTARAINADAPANLARAAKQTGARMIHVSTDYVFNGHACTPYTETDPTDPNSVYGQTKLDGERQLLQILPHAVIIRTAWLYSPHGRNFVKTMLNLGQQKDQLRVVFDQVGSPTYALDLAHAIKTVIDAQQWRPGVYHYSNEGAISWFDFTKAIHQLAGINNCQVEPCRTDEFPAKAHRPAYSVLDKQKFKSTFNTTVPYWRDSLQHCLERLFNS